MQDGSVAIVFGTRPEIIKLAPIIRELRATNLPFFVVHSNQHYSYDMDKIFFQDLELPEADFNLHVGSGDQGAQTAKIIERSEQIFLKEKPVATLVHGDTNTTLGASLASVKLHIPVCHIEAGLRSGDRRMPEEINRIVTDHCSDLLFAPTVGAENNLVREGISIEKIKVTGNTIVDSLERHSKIANKSKILQEYSLERRSYILATLHRPENVDDASKLSSILTGLNDLKKKTGLEVLLPVHPRTRKNMEMMGLSTQDLLVVDPLGYLDFLMLENNAAVIVTDSGGIQEEACILGVPCVTLRNSTERPETIEVGANILAGSDPIEIVQRVLKMMGNDARWINPFGDGKSAERIIEILSQKYALRRPIVAEM